MKIHEKYLLCELYLSKRTEYLFHATTHWKKFLLEASKEKKKHKKENLPPEEGRVPHKQSTRSSRTSAEMKTGFPGIQTQWKEDCASLET